MTRSEAWLVHASCALVGVTGVIYGWMRYFAEPADEFAVVNHPAQPLLQHLHVLVAPLLVFACGLVWRDHVWARIRSSFPLRRPTGLLLAALFAPMAASGYGLQVAVDDVWRRVWIVVHVATSVLWIGGYLVHQLSPRGTRPGARPRRALERPADAPQSEQRTAGIH